MYLHYATIHSKHSRKFENPPNFKSIVPKLRPLSNPQTNKPSNIARVVPEPHLTFGNYRRDSNLRLSQIMEIYRLKNVRSWISGWNQTLNKYHDSGNERSLTIWHNPLRIHIGWISTYRQLRRRIAATHLNHSYAVKRYEIRRNLRQRQSTLKISILDHNPRRKFRPNRTLISPTSLTIKEP